MILAALLPAALVGWITGAHLAGPHLERRWEWDRAPSLRLGPTLSEPQRAAAVDAWHRLEALGADVGPIVTAGPYYAPGLITVTTLDLAAHDGDYPAGGWSSTEDARTGHATRADIELGPQADSDTALHELLHVYGFDDVSMSGHVMTRERWRQGSGVQGIRRAIERQD